MHAHASTHPLAGRALSNFIEWYFILSFLKTTLQADDRHG
jgi:hypothetical protein